MEFDTRDLLISWHIPDFDKIRKQHIKWRLLYLSMHVLNIIS